MQDCSNFSALAMELLQSCAKPLMCIIDDCVLISMYTDHPDNELFFGLPPTWYTALSSLAAVVTPLEWWICDMCFRGMRYKITHDGNSLYGIYTILFINPFWVTVDAINSPWGFHTLRLRRQFQIDILMEIAVLSLSFPWRLVTKFMLHFKSVLVWIVAWRRRGHNLLTELVIVYFTDSYMRH